MGKVVLLRTSERTSFVRCRQQWWWAYVKGLSSKAAKPALRFGDLYHQSLAAYYQPGTKRGPHPAKTFARLYRKEARRTSGFGIRDVNEEWQDAGDLGVEMLEMYVEEYGRDPEIEVIYPEHPFWYRLKDLTGQTIYYVGRFDAVVRYMGRVAIFEHKTAQSISDEYLQMDEQAGSYWAFGPSYLRKKGILPADEILDCILYNFSRKAKRDVRPTNESGHFLNQDGTVSKRQPPPYFERIEIFRDAPDRKRIVRRIRAQAWEMRLSREGKLPIYKNPTRDCPWQCQFFAMCELHETGANWKEIARQNFTLEDPYAEYKEDLREARRQGVG
jgi:hypothetical protein